MPLVSMFDTPGSLRDAPDGSPFYQQWHDFIAGQMTPDVTSGSRGGEFFDPSASDADVVATRSLTWMGFPRALLAVNNRDDREAAFAEGENRDKQEEYLEWHVTRNREGKITKVIFVTETIEYWYCLAQTDPGRVVELYRTLVSPAVTEPDLFMDGRYDWRNRWNTTDGIVHYILGKNAMRVAIGLARGSVDSGDAADNYELTSSSDSVPFLSSADPRVILDVGALARKRFAVTLREPIGLYIAGWDDSGWTRPDGTAVGDYWRIVRGTPGAALRVEYEVPAAAGFVVGDIRIGGRPVQYGGQLAEHVTVMIGGLAGGRRP